MLFNHFSNMGSTCQHKMTRIWKRDATQSDEGLIRWTLDMSDTVTLLVLVPCWKAAAQRTSVQPWHCPYPKPWHNPSGGLLSHGVAKEGNLVSCSLWRGDPHILCRKNPIVLDFIHLIHVRLQWLLRREDWHWLSQISFLRGWLPAKAFISIF